MGLGLGLKLGLGDYIQLMLQDTTLQMWLLKDSKYYRCILSLDFTATLLDVKQL